VVQQHELSLLQLTVGQQHDGLPAFNCGQQIDTALQQLTVCQQRDTAFLQLSVCQQHNIAFLPLTLEYYALN
jgi:hypothetical protein